MGLLHLDLNADNQILSTKIEIRTARAQEDMTHASRQRNKQPAFVGAAIYPAIVGIPWPHVETINIDHARDRSMQSYDIGQDDILTLAACGHSIWVLEVMVTTCMDEQKRMVRT